MTHDTTQFLDLLLAHTHRQEGFLTFTAIHPTADQPRPSRHVGIHPLNARKLITDLEALAAANRLGWGAYVAIALRRCDLGRWHRGTKEQLAGVPAVFVDIDEAPDVALPRLERLPAPSLVVSSGRGIHAYYWIKPAPIEAADRTIKAINQVVGGDPRMTVASSLRLPGTQNTKPAIQQPCRILHRDDHAHYALDAFPKLQSLPVPAPRLSTQRSDRLNPAVIQAVLDALCARYGARPKSATSRWYYARCPFPHQRDHVGSHFAFDVTTGAGNCFGRHGGLSLKTLCDVLQIDAKALGDLYLPPQ